MTEINHQRQAVILSATRTPMGRFQGSLSPLSATQLGAEVIRAAVERAGLKDLASIDEVFMGNVVSAGLGQAPARQAAIKAGLPPTVGATTINKVCGSGLKAGMLASQAIRVDDGDLFHLGARSTLVLQFQAAPSFQVDVCQQVSRNAALQHVVDLAFVSMVKRAVDVSQ